MMAAATRSDSSTTAVAEAAADDGSTATVAAPQTATAAMEGMEQSELCEPSEDGEIPPEELTKEQRVEMQMDKIRNKMEKKGMQVDAKMDAMLTRFVTARLSKDMDADGAKGSRPAPTRPCRSARE